MAATRLQTKGATGTTDPLAATFDSTTTLGSLIVVGIITGFNSFSALVGISDNKGNTYAQIGTGLTVGNSVFSMYYTFNNAGGATHAVSADFSASGQTNSILMREYSGITTTSPLDATGGTTGSGTAVSVTASGATTQANELSILMVGVQNSTTLTGTNGYGNATVQGSGPTVGIADLDLIATATPTATGTISFSSWGAKVATFKEGSSGPAASNKTFNNYQFMKGGGSVISLSERIK